MIVPDGSIPRELSEITCTSTTRSSGHSTSHVLVLMRSPPRIGKNGARRSKGFYATIAGATTGTINF